MKNIDLDSSQQLRPSEVTETENIQPEPALDPAAVIRMTFELSQLRREARHGWLRIGENPESVAEHTQRAAALGFLLAHMEDFSDPNLVVTMIIFHDMHEGRTGDADVIQRKYLNLDSAERAALHDQTSDLGMAGNSIRLMWQEVETGSTTAGTIAKDAEVLEMAFTARELVWRGNKEAQLWIDSCESRLRTSSAQTLLAQLGDADPHEWWKRMCT